MKTGQKQPTEVLQKQRLAKIIATLAEANGVTPRQVIARIRENRQQGRPQFDMKADDWSRYAPASPMPNGK